MQTKRKIAEETENESTTIETDIQDGNQWTKHKLWFIHVLRDVKI